MQNLSYDAMILGGGPGGATAALLLARAGWRVAVVEKAVYPRRKVCGEFMSATSRAMLDALGVGAAFDAQAGPEVREVGLFAGTTMLRAPMPRVRTGPYPWGRALGRETLDKLLLAQAAQAGAVLWQPWKAESLARMDGVYHCQVRHAGTAALPGQTLRAAVVIAAHGSWETGPLATQPMHRAPCAADLYGFKAHFHGSALPAGLMPLLIFPGGYGGMVGTDQARTSLSCCIRRDRLAQVRARWPDLKAGEAVLEHIRTACRGVAETLDGAVRDGSVLAAGPIRPGLRDAPDRGLFLLGNAAGEAHPIIAEGISMAMQAAWQLCDVLIPLRGIVHDGHGLHGAHDLDAAYCLGGAHDLDAAHGLGGARDPHAAHGPLGAWDLHDTHDVPGMPRVPGANQTARHGAALDAAAAAYRRQWRQAFAGRIHAAQLFAAVAVRPAATAAVVPLLRALPQLLTLGAHWSGKARQVVPHYV